MTFYLDTSVLVSALTPDDHTPRARRWLAAEPAVIVSGWTQVEFGAVIRRQARIGRIDRNGVLAAETSLARLVSRPNAFRPVTPEDVVEAGRLVRDFEPLRAPDALHLAIAMRLELPVATFDEGLATAVRATVGAVIPV